MHDAAMLLAVLVATLRAATPLVLAGLGELVAERAGVLNLGLEGMMLVGAVTGFIAAVATGNLAWGLLAAMLAGAAMAAAFAFLTLGLRANQVATGLALTIFGVGFSALVGNSYQSQPIQGLATTLFPELSTAGPLLQQVLLIDPLVWLSLVAPVLVHRFLYRSRAGLILRAVGESHDVAHAFGYHVIRIRVLATLFGGAMSGLAGAYLSLAYTPMWTENMVAGRGWIALALVVFSTWKPGWLVVGAWLFGFVTIAGFQAEALGLSVSPQLLATLPYLSTIIVLVLISRDRVRLKLNAPAALGKPFNPAA
ncbi:ABC transporter permease [Limobrevibacterium gyesilva]|uniref:ABC transporter permease n=1 Tax=Limobrevibacterium gyesilva TaxID=2991712 RepID=A0AA41YHP2_9PROT|nr:ABC transporter permease [Limobrevibacterium gyesilva]MCW3473586.1 ABC transporter permease [Limobrevibacterium gyesilva]